MQGTESYPEPMPSRGPVDPALIHKALMRMRQAARGNGINPNTILLDYFDGEVLQFQGKSLFEIRTNVSEKTMPGRSTAGEVCASEADLKARINQAVERTTLDWAIVAAATEFLERRADSGFMADGLTMKLDRLNKAFIFYRACSACHSSGKVNCAPCGATGVKNCPKCKGIRTLRCPTCRGRREARLKNGKIGTCPKCHGQAEAPCNYCHRTGKIKCKPCKATGKVSCTRCAASGIVSEIAYVNFEARTGFTYNRESLPPEVPSLIDQTGPALAERKHALVKILHAKEQAAVQDQHRTEMQKSKNPDELVVPFDVSLPWGAIGFRVGDRVLNGRLFGLHPRLLNVPHFLDGAILPGVDRLTQAAHHPAKAKANIDEAIRFRVIGDALAAAATMPAKKAAVAIRQHWPLGLSAELSDRIVLLADKAFVNMTKVPRLMGLIIGLGLGAGVWAAYLIGPLRGIAANQGLPPPAMAALDAVLVIAIGYMCMTLSQMSARHAARTVFRKIMPPDKAGKILPRAGHVGLAAFAGSFIVFMIMLGLAFWTGAVLPEWVSFLLGV